MRDEYWAGYWSAVCRPHPPVSPRWPVMHSYTEEFFRRNCEGSQRSAAEIVPLVLQLVQPRHVVDVGCGTGTWLAVFREHGATDVLGIDGEHVNRRSLKIPQDQFLAYDLRNPLTIHREFDLVVSVEVAEHLPAECADMFVNSLTGLGPVILFSAAIPFQGGVDHVNEQWPDYWVDLFARRSYVVIDCLRKRIWGNKRVEYWYAQNILLFVRRGHLEHQPLLKREFEQAATSQLSIVHPKQYLEVINWMGGMELVNQGIAAFIPLGAVFIMVDEGKFGGGIAAGRHVIPFLERDGQYWGPPPDDATAISELERLRHTGASFIAFGWPALWWLDSYTGFRDHLSSNFTRVLANDHLVVFDLRSRGEAGHG
jgi:SAM-dependent methyltransferase